MRARIAFVAVALLAVGCGDRELSGEEIVHLFSGSTVEGHHDLHGYDFHSQYGTDGTLSSWQGHPPSLHQGTWWVDGDRICLRWDGQGSDLCRVITTDDDGHYWKVLHTRGGRERRIVTFHSFTGPGGDDRAVRGDVGAQVRSFVWGGGGVFLVFALGIAVLIALVALRAGADDPWSPRNRLWRRFGTLTLGDRTYRWAEIAAGPDERLEAFMHEAAAAIEPIPLAWAFELLRERTGDVGAAWQRMMRALAPFSDALLLQVLGPTLAPLGPNGGEIQRASQNDLRACYLAGETFRLLATKARDKALFERYKAAALSLLQHARAQVSDLPDALAEASPYRSPPTDEVDYVSLAGPAFEAAMYMPFVAAAATARNGKKGGSGSGYSSSSYSGGG